MSLFCRAKNLSPPAMRDSVVQFYNMKIPHSRMLERPNELSQTPIFTEVRGVLWKPPQVEGPVSFKISEIFVGKELDVWRREEWRRRWTMRWFHPSFSIALVLILNIPFNSCKVGYLMWSSFLVILQFLFYHPRSNFLHIHAGSSMESILEVENWREEGQERE